MISTNVAQLIDTNVLVYRVDARFPKKQEAAANHLEETVYAVVTRPLPGLKRTLLTSGEAREEP